MSRCSLPLLVAVAASMLLTLISAACFTGGLINRLVDSRLTGLAGRRAVPACPDP